MRKGDYNLLWLPRPFGIGDGQLDDLPTDPSELIVMEQNGRQPEPAVLNAQLTVRWHARRCPENRLSSFGGYLGRLMPHEFWGDCPRYFVRPSVVK